MSDPAQTTICPLEDYDTPAWQANTRLNAKLEIAITALERIFRMEAFEFDPREVAREALRHL